MGDEQDQPVLELRIHGISNTPPWALLSTGEDNVYRASGDETTGFYRKKDCPVENGVLTEAYSWGQLTAGLKRKDLARGFWTFLLPLAVSNVGFWSRRDLPATGARTGGFSAWLARVLCLSLTATFSLAATTIGVDLLAWQRLQVGFRGLGWALLVPLLVVTALWVIARVTFHYEQVAAVAPATDEPPGSLLAHPSFWRGDRQVRVLASIHLGTGWLVAAAATVSPVVHADLTGGPAGRPPSWASWTVAGLLGFLGLCALGLLASSQVTDRADRADRARWFAIAAALVVAGVLGYLWRWPHRLPLAHGQFPGISDAIFGLFLAQFLCVVLLAVWVRCAPAWRALAVLVIGAVAVGTGVLRNDEDGWLRILLLLLVVLGLVLLPARKLADEAWGGRSAALLIGLGWLLGALYSAGALAAAALLLGFGGYHIQRPAAIDWSASALLPCFLTVALTVLLFFLSGRRAGRRGAAEVLTRYREDEATAGTRAREVARAEWLHDFVETRLLTWVGRLALLASLIAAAGLAATTTGRRPTEGSWPLALATNTGLAVATLVPVLLAIAGLLVYRWEPLRAKFGVLWDLGSFWPRSGHPLAPPCYAERCIPELISRVTTFDGGVIVAGHSQGALLAGATALQLSQEQREATYLLTFGTQLTALYGRIFPGVFGGAGRTLIASKMPGRWESFYRRTDYLGFPIHVAEVPDHLLTDPVALTGALSTIHRHSDYPRDAVYQARLLSARDKIKDVPVPIEGFTERKFPQSGRTHVVYAIGPGEAPAVVLLHELGGLSPEAIDLARRLAGEGYRVEMPLLFGRPGQGSALRGAVQACVSREFRFLSTGGGSPASDWVIALCQDLRARADRPVAVVGMCLTAGLALAAVLDKSVTAAVSSQPALPLPLWFGRASSLGFTVSEPCDKPVLALRFRRDLLCPRSRLAALPAAFPAAECIVVPAEGMSYREAKPRIPLFAHAVLTEDLQKVDNHPTQQALERVLTFLHEHLAGGNPP